MEMDQISLQTLDRASIDIRRTLLHLSRPLGLLIPLSLRAKAHTLARTQRATIPRSVCRLYRPRHPLAHLLPFHPVQCRRLTSASPPPPTSKIHRIHQVSAKYRNPLLSPFFFVSPRLPYVRNDHANGMLFTKGEGGWTGSLQAFTLRIQGEPKLLFSFQRVFDRSIVSSFPSFRSN